MVGDRWTEQRVNEHQLRVGAKAIKPQDLSGIKAIGKQADKYYRSQAEEDFANECIWPWYCDKKIKWWGYECITFDLPGEKQTYTPDFPFMLADKIIVIAEIKGGFEWRQAIEKFKTAAGVYDFLTWQLWDKAGRKGEWKMKREY